jgi:hypothetical protein
LQCEATSSSAASSTVPVFSMCTFVAYLEHFYLSISTGKAADARAKKNASRYDWLTKQEKACLQIM